MISSDQIRAARALLNWSQGDLADRTGLATPTIGNMEIGKHTPSLKSQEKIITAFDEAGVEFIDDGVRKKTNLLEVFEGNDYYLRFLYYLYHDQKDNEDPEWLLMFADDRASPPEVNDSIRRIRNAGVKMRQLVEQGNTYLMGPSAEYRYVPSEYFLNRFTCVFGDKYAVITKFNGAKRTMIFNDPELAEVQRMMFELLWSILPKPVTSSAKEGF